jgi:hypothetical protein
MLTEQGKSPMAILNFRINNLTERSGQAAQRVTQYLLREGTYAPAEVDYLLRTSEDTRARGDFVDQVTGNLPAWAHDDAGAFFAAAEAYERGGSRRAGRWATTWQIALPRELTRQEQWAMGTAFVATHLRDHAYLCVMHDPVKDGQHQPHLHVLFSCSGLRTGTRGLANKGWCRPALYANTPTGGPALGANGPTLVCKRLANRFVGQHTVRRGQVPYNQASARLGMLPTRGLQVKRAFFSAIYPRSPIVFFSVHVYDLNPPEL